MPHWVQKIPISAQHNLTYFDLADLQVTHFVQQTYYSKQNMTVQVSKLQNNRFCVSDLAQSAESIDTHFACDDECLVHEDKWAKQNVRNNCFAVLLNINNIQDIWIECYSITG